MATNNIKRIALNNLSLNPQMLSKNTNQMVNACINNIYKQIPKKFRNDLVRVASTREENKGPLRILQTQLEILGNGNKYSLSKTQFPAKAVNLKKNNNKGIPSVAAGSKYHSKDSSVLAQFSKPKTLLKSPSYKIYSARRFGSSSSSKSTITRRHNERRRQVSSHNKINFLSQAYNSGTIDRIFNELPARNQQLTMLMSNNGEYSDIKKELMSVDTMRKLLNRSTLKKSGNKINFFKNIEDPKNSWDHPPNLEKFQLPLSFSRGIENDFAAKNSLKNKLPKNKHSSMVDARASTIAVPAEKLSTIFNQTSKPDKSESNRRKQMKKLGLIETLSDTSDLSNWPIKDKSKKSPVSSSNKLLPAQKCSKTSAAIRVKNDNVLSRKPKSSPSSRVAAWLADNCYVQDHLSKKY